MPGQSISNPAGAFGQTAQFDGFKIPLLAAGAITGPAAVSLAATVGYVTLAATDAPTQCIGIITDSAQSGHTTLVTILGVARSCPAAGTIAQFAILKPSATTAGRVSATATPVTGEAIGIAMAASASNVVDVWVEPGVALS